ncbi:MAG: cytochrome c, partial [Balneolaceae bacterium]
QNVPENEMEQFDVDLAELRSIYEQEQAEEEALAEARAASAGDDEPSAEVGERLYVQNACQACHSLDGSRLVGPSFQGLFGSERNFEDGTTATADEEYLRESITMPGAKIVEGYNNAMVAYDYLSDSEIESLIEFIKTQSDN